MFTVLRSNWRTLKRGTSGSRFENLYRKRRASRKGSGAARRVITLVIGCVLVIGGPIVGLVPGPGGILVSVFGWALLASEVLVVARWLDWLEPKLVKLWRPIARKWKRASVVSRVGVCLGAACVVAMSGLAIRAYLAS